MDEGTLPPALAISQRAAQFAETRRRALHGAASRAYQLMLPVQWLGSLLLGLTQSASNGAGDLCTRGPGVITATTLNTLITVIMLVVTARAADHRATGYLIGTSQVLFYVLLMCIGASQFDTHLYLLISLGFLAFYRDWRLLAAVAAASLAAQCVYSGIVCSGPYGSDNSLGYHLLVFSLWVLVAIYALTLVCNRGNSLFRSIGRELAVVELQREASHRQLLERTRQLEASNEQYRALLESTSAVPWELDDGTGACRYIGSQVEHHWGWAAEEFRQKSFLFSCVHPDDRPAFAQALEDAVAAQEVAVECRLQLKSEKFAHVRSFIRHAPGESGRIVRGISIDITTQKKLESELYQAQKLESVGRLAAGVAHEINTPVQFVNDNCYFLRDAVGEVRSLLEAYRNTLASVAAGTLSLDDAREQLRAAEQAADLEFLSENMPTAVERALEGLERVAVIVRSMKEFSHPDQTGPSSADLNAAIRSTLTIARNEYKYVADVETNLADIPLVLCRVSEFNQAFLNIVVNAAHAITDVVTGTGHRGLITITTRQDAEDILVLVQDTGGGIAPAIQDKIFDPFFTTKAVGKGTGQGLAIARSIIVDKHGGQLTFESQPGTGTTFIIRIPTAPARGELDGAVAA